MLELIKSVKFKKVKNKFLDQLHKDISTIKKSKIVFIFADKTWNIFEIDKSTIKKSKIVLIFADKTWNVFVLDKNTHSKLLTNNISKTCKKRSVIYTTISIKKLNLLQVIMEFQCFAKSNAFVSLKNYKPNVILSPNVA